jgi:hypothetical protein
MQDLGINSFSECHLDPDLINNRSAKNWMPAIGQVGASSSELKNRKIGKGDLFVFFGRYQKVDHKNAAFSYSNDKEMHAAWGYMEVEERYNAQQIRNGEIPEALKKHPHATIDHLKSQKTNVIFTAKKELSFMKGVSGHGTFKWNESQRLSSEKVSGVARWEPIQGLKPLGNRIKAENDLWNSGGRGREFIIEITNQSKFDDWFKGVLNNP